MVRDTGSKVKVNSLGSDNRGQEESYRRPLEVVQIYRVLLIEKRNLKDFQLMSV